VGGRNCGASAFTSSTSRRLMASQIHSAGSTTTSNFFTAIAPCH
jgi:hypothetical protein